MKKIISVIFAVCLLLMSVYRNPGIVFSAETAKIPETTEETAAILSEDLENSSEDTSEIMEEEETGTTDETETESEETDIIYEEEAESEEICSTDGTEAESEETGCIHEEAAESEETCTMDVPEPEYSMTAIAEDGIQVMVTSPESSLPCPAEAVTVTAERVLDERAAALVDDAVADTNLENGTVFLYDVCLWNGEEEIQPTGPVVVTFQEVASEQDEEAKVFHVNEEKGKATDMNAELTEEGDVVVNTSHFSLYAVVLPPSGKFTMDLAMEAVWDQNTRSITSLVFKVSNSNKDNVYYGVKYTDGSSEDGPWTNASDQSAKTKKGTQAVLSVYDNALSGAPLNRLFRIYGTADNKNYSYTGTITIYDILESIKSGFLEWLENNYVPYFGGQALPETQQSLYEAFAVYYELPSLTISEEMRGNAVYLNAETDGEGTYVYEWEYQDEEGNWQKLCEDTGKSVNASSVEALQHGETNVRCRMYEETDGGKALKAISNTLAVDPVQRAYDQAIQEINTGLNLGNLKINGTAFTDYFYYGNVARDTRVPFEDAATYANYLAKTYLDAGGGSQGLQAVQKEWDKYLYDLYDPNAKSNTKVYPEFTYGDTDLEWPKDSTSSFHGTLAPEVKALDYNFEERGIDYSHFIKSLNKSVTVDADAAGDKNTERKYNVDITADAQAQAVGPVAMIFQIQTSWQMFDLEHANAVQGDGYTQVGSASNNSEIANLYDIKQALLRFVDYMQDNYQENNLVIGITEVQHAKSQTMFSGTDASGKALYVTNNYDILRQSIRNWDSFGNCEHVHYDTDKLVNAVSNLSSNLSGWKDMYGYPVSYNDIEKVAVIIGGTTENSDSTNGYGCTLPWTTFQSKGLNGVYGIRTNKGTPNGDGVISWLENSDNNTGAAFRDGKGSTFTEKYVATTEDAVFESLVRIAEKEMRRKGMDITATDKYVENTVITDTVSREFVVDTTEPITATIYNKDGSIATQTTVELTDPNLTITGNESGTTTVRYNFGNVYNTKKCVLHFGIAAREDYIGSNNVYSNVGTPTLDYQRSKTDGTVESYQVECEDTPQVNVPIRFNTVDGGTADIEINDQVDLADLSTEIAENAENLVERYPQINGTLSYVWVLPDGSEEPVGSVTVENGSIGEQTFPDRSYHFTGTKAGSYIATLKVTFTPEDVDGANKNFSDTATAVAVNKLTKPGNVWINVTGSGGETFDGPATLLRVTKEWADGAGKHEGDSVTVTLYEGEEGAEVSAGQRVILNAKNNWTADFRNLPYQDVNGNVIRYSAKETNGVEGYYSIALKVETKNAGAWVPDTSGIQDGKTYVFTRTVDGSTGALANITNSLTVTNLGTIGGSVKLGDITYASSLPSVTDDIKWKAIVNEDGTYTFQNVSTGKYLAIKDGDFVTSSSQQDGTDGTIKSTTKFYWNGNTLYGNYKDGNKNKTKYLEINDKLEVSAKDSTSKSLIPYRCLTDPQLGLGNVENFAEKYYTQTIQNYVWDPINGDDPDLGFTAKYNKTIDSLGDTGENADTEAAGNDLYRLYLDFSGQKNALDMLIVEDSTTSMQTSYGTSTRIQTLDELINGTIKGSKPASGNYTESLYSQAAREKDGFVYKVLKQNPDNKVAVIKLAGENAIVDNNHSYEDSKDQVAEVVREWTSAGDSATLTPEECYTNVITMKSGTEYDSAYLRMDELLQQVAGDGNAKIVLFISDGEPNIVINEDGILEKDNTKSSACEKTLQAWQKFREKYPSLPVYTVGIYNGNEDATELLQAMSGADRFTEASSMDILRTTLQNILDSLEANQFSVTDQLSQYVDWYGACPDLKVVRTDADGTETVLWKSDGAAEEGFIGTPVNNRMVQNGEEIDVVQSVTFTPASDDDSHGTLQVIFNPVLQVDGNTKYTVSYNVRTSDEARSEYINRLFAREPDGYGGMMGDEQTDYGNNRTSSHQLGFRSNHTATVSCSFNGQIRTMTYQHPVVQVSPEDYELPQSGGIGTYVFTVIGAALLMTAILLLYREKQRRQMQER
ncbi:MAG: Cna B-type domain-containing protein [Hominisplanchenecus sp.]